MQPTTSKFTLRTDPELLKKFRYVAEYNARSANRELEIIMRRHVVEYESKYGKMGLDGPAL